MRTFERRFLSFVNVLWYPVNFAQKLGIKQEQLHKERYWQLDLSKEIRYRSDQEYVEHFSALFREAVRCRLRSFGPIGAELSGGVDSSSVVCMIQAFRREEVVDLPDFTTFSSIYPGLPCDESNYIMDVVQMWHLNAVTHSPTPPQPTWYINESQRYQDLPNYPNAATADQLKFLVKERGIRVLLTGNGADHYLTGTRPYYADLVRRFKVLPLARQLYADVCESKSLFMFATQILKPELSLLLSTSVRQLIKKLMRRPDQSLSWDWLHLKFVQQTQLIERQKKDKNERYYGSADQQYLYRLLTNGWSTHFGEMDDRSAAWSGLESRHPFFDRRLVEFALTIPEEQRWRNGQTKFVLRQAMQGLLPESVRQRGTKAEFSHLFAETLYFFETELIVQLSCVGAKEWVDISATTKMYQRMLSLYKQADSEYRKYTWLLWSIWGIELWLQTVFQQQTSFRNDITSSLMLMERNFV